MRGGGFSAEELGWFRMDMAKLEAEGLGFEWTPHLQYEVRRCVQWFRRNWNEKRESKAGNDERFKAAQARRQQIREEQIGGSKRGELALARKKDIN
jgi:hypothetical protein